MLINIKKKKKKKAELGQRQIYVNPSKIYINPAFKSIQITYKTTAHVVLKFHMQQTRLQGFRMIKFRVVGNQRWPLLLKLAKPLKSTFPPEPLDIF